MSLMSASSSLRKAAYALPIAFALASGAADAGGLTPGQCYAKADAEAVLKQEGQKPIIIGNRITDDSNVNVFFVNDKGYGYNLEGDQPNGTPSKKICVASSYKDVHVNSLDNPEIPSWAAGIKPSGRGADLKKAYNHGGRVIFAAQSYTLKGDQEVPGKYIVVLASTQDKLASAWGVDHNGIPDNLFSMRDFSVTPHMNTLLSSPTKKAASETGATVALAPVR